MRMSVPSVNVDEMSKHNYGLWKEVSHKIFGDQYHEVWGYIWGGGPKEFDHVDMLMWLCQMMNDEVILDVQIDWLTIPCTNTNLRVGHCSRLMGLVACEARLLADRFHWRGNLQQIL